MRADFALPTKNRKLEPYTTGEPIVFQSKGETHELQSHRLCGGACRRRSAGRHRSVARGRDRLGQDHRVPSLPLGPRPRRRRSDGYGAARRRPRLAGREELIRRALEAAKSRPGVKICCGVGTDHLEPDAGVGIDDIIRAYEEQIEAIEAMGGQTGADGKPGAGARAPKRRTTMCGSTAASCARCAEPVIIHWLGEMFDPALAGYWGSDDHTAAMENCLGIISDNAAKIDGVKISLLSKDKEIEMRRKLPAGVRMYTGDDFNYAELIAGDEQGYSDALLGIFDAIAPAASAGLARARRPATCKASTASWSQPFRCRVTSSRRRPASTKPASCSSPGSTACRIISSWSVGRRARGRSCISPSCSARRQGPRAARSGSRGIGMSKLLAGRAG